MTSPAAFICGTALFNASHYGIFIFTITTAVIPIHRFGRMFRRVDEMKVLLEKFNQGLEEFPRESRRP
ncbi:MAG: hypothetical protein LBP32_02335 [Spirochaetaceae bacterium]|nr:hypothetical protein [Spirochaetaceae bacterium]